MANATPYAKPARWFMFFVAVALLLGLNPYRLQELLACWLFFSLAFIILALLVFAALFVYCAGERVIHWASTTGRVIPKVAFDPSQLHLKEIPSIAKLK